MTTLTDRTGTLEIAGKRVSRLGFGTMRLTGRGIWGQPADRDECIAVLRRAVELGVQFIDTADSYGPAVVEDLVRIALHPYADDVVIATKAGLTRNGPDVIDTDSGPRHLGPAAWPPLGRPEYLRQQALLSLRHLGLDQIDLFQLHRIDPQVPLADQVGELKNLQDEGKIVAIGLSQVTLDQLAEAQKIVRISTVQSRYNLNDRSAQDMLETCEKEGIALIPWAPLAQGGLDGRDGPLARIAERHHAGIGQIALAWLLATSGNILPIPGTSQRSHLEDNLAAARIQLTDDDMAELTAATD